MDKQLEIHRLLEHDVPEMLSIADACGLSRWSQQAYLDEIARTDSIGFGARISSSLAGFIIGRIVPTSSESDSPDAEIFNIGVSPAHMRRGYGTQLIDHFIKECLKHSAGWIWLEVRSGNARAIGFYEMHGFVEFHKRKAFYSSPADDAVVMRLRLSEHAGT